MKNLELQYKALANIRRLAILKYLKGGHRATVGEIVGVIRLKLKATSKHLRVLAANDFVDREQQGLNVYYFLPEAKPILLKRALDLL